VWRYGFLKNIFRLFKENVKLLR